MASSSGSKESASLADLVNILRLRRSLIALIAGAVLVTTLVWTAFVPRWYLATTKVRVEKPESDVKLFQAAANSAYDPYFLQDQFRIMQSEKILYPVIDRLNLNTRLAASVGAAGATLTSDVTYRYLAKEMLRVESQRSSSLIEINVLAQEPALAADIANEVARGIGQSAQETGVPHAFGVLTCDTLEQAIDRAGLKMGNKGAEAAWAAIEMANLTRFVRTTLFRRKPSRVAKSGVKRQVSAIAESQTSPSRSASPRNNRSKTKPAKNKRR